MVSVLHNKSLVKRFDKKVPQTTYIQTYLSKLFRYFVIALHKRIAVGLTQHVLNVKLYVIPSPWYSKTEKLNLALQHILRGFL